MAEQKGTEFYQSPYKFNGKELDADTGLYYYGARYYDPKVSVFLSVDPLTEKYPNVNSYVYCFQNPINLIDPTGMAPVDDSIDVVKNEDGTYKVVGGKADGDKNIYLVNNANDKERTGEVIGESLTEYSFLDEKGNAIIGAIIDGSDTSGINFLNKEIINGIPPGLKELIKYMWNARGEKHFDFKMRGVDKSLTGNDKVIETYRGMLFQNIDGGMSVDGGNTIFASARDFGNVAAGWMAGVNGFTWDFSRSGFDGLESSQKYWPSTEGQPTQLAQKVGHNAGYKSWATQNPIQYRNREKNGLN